MIEPDGTRSTGGIVRENLQCVFFVDSTKSGLGGPAQPSKGVNISESTGIQGRFRMTNPPWLVFVLEQIVD